MGIGFERFLRLVDHWIRTGEWKGHEFRVRRIGPFSSGLLTFLALALLAAFIALNVYLVIDGA